MVLVVNTKCLEYYSGTIKPKFVRVEYSNGQVDLIHYLNNGTATLTTVRPKLTLYKKMKKKINSIVKFNYLV